MKRLLMILFTLPVLFASVYADDFEYKIIKARTLLEQGHNHWDESEMQSSLAQFQRLLHLEQEKWLVHFYIAFANYRLSTYYMDKDKEKAGRFIDEALDQLKNSQKLNDSFPESYALMSSCYGNKIGLTPWKGMILGPRSGMTMEKAITLGPENPRVWLLKGVGTNFSPKAFGGGAEKAIEELQKAIHLYENEEPLNPIHPQWGHDEAYAWLGIILKKQGRLEEAKKAYEDGLAVNPQCGWIKYSLLPDLQKKLKTE